MITAPGRLLLAAAIVVAAAAAAPPAHAQGAPGALHLLDVPYLPQSEALCGGAAAAMVMRYWGATGVYAETFTPLVDREAGGIRGADLLRDLHGRGWQATSFRGDPPSVQQHLSARRPVIALIEDAPGRFHYVVLVGWASGRVVLHDPARAPFRVIDEAAFMRAWERSGFWTMLALRDSSAAPPAEAGEERPATSAGSCQGLVDEGLRLAGSGQRDDARATFEVAALECPNRAAPWRELAGLHALGNDWAAAAANARRALAREANDEQAARILATALYLEGDTRGALSAWNTAGEPRIDLVNVKGLDRTRFQVAAAALGVAPGEVLTPRLVDRAQRRLAELPSAQVARAGYTPVPGGRATVDAVVIERPLAPTSLPALAVIGVHALTDREAAVSFASPSGGGELWRASWRWWENRPRVAVAFDAPAPFGGTWGIEAAHDEQAYASGGLAFDEVRRTATVRMSDWTRTSLRWQVSGGLEDIRGRGRSARGGLELDQRLFDDRLSLRAAGTAWTFDRGAWSASVRPEWRSTMRREGLTWLGRGGVAFAGAAAPFAGWPGAGTGQGRDLLLRAHPLLHDGIVEGSVFGRRVVDAGIEARWWRPLRRGLVRVAPAVFADAARATKGLPGSDTRAHVDVGAGLRLAVPGSGVLRLDFARGLRDGGFVFSAGWVK